MQNMLGAVLLRTSVLQVVDKLRVILEDSLHLGVELLQVEPGHGVHQESAHHRHERDDEQGHDEHELHVKAAEHGSTPFLGWILSGDAVDAENMKRPLGIFGFRNEFPFDHLVIVLGLVIGHHRKSCFCGNYSTDSSL